MRLIDADALLKDINDLIQMWSGGESFLEIGHTNGLETAKVYIVDAPTIDAEPVRHGKWIEHHEPYTWMGYTYWSCSECGFECGYEKDITIRTNCCPNCGARMNEVNNEN